MTSYLANPFAHSEQTEAAASTLAIAKKLHDQREFAKAAEVCQLVIANEPRNAAALLLLGSASIGLNQPAAANIRASSSSTADLPVRCC